MAGQKPSQQSFKYPQFPHPQPPHPQSPHSRPQFPYPQFQHYGTPPPHQPQKQPPYRTEQYMHRLHEQYNHMHAKMYEKYLTEIKKLLEQFVTVNRRNAEEAGVDAANAILQDQEVMRLLGPQNDGCDTQDESRKEETRALMEIVGSMSDELGIMFEKFERLDKQQKQNSSDETVSTQLGVLTASFNDLRAAFQQQKQDSSDETVSTQLGVLTASFNDLRAAFQQQKQNSPCLLKSSPSHPDIPTNTPPSLHYVQKRQNREKKGVEY